MVLVLVVPGAAETLNRTEIGELGTWGIGYIMNNRVAPAVSLSTLAT